MSIAAEQPHSAHAQEDATAVAVAVDLDSVSPTVAYSATGGLVTGGELRPIHNRIPPSVLIPRLAGEPLRLDLSYPAHPRGSGLQWPPEAVLPADRSGGRIPLLHAWDSFARDSESVWEWKPGSDHVYRVRAVDALAGAFAVLAEHGRSNETLSHAPLLVVPNRMTSAQQQRLIDAIRAQGTDVRLLWRPVAAASYWCAHQGGKVGGFRPGKQHLLAVHMGLDEWEVSVLELVSTESGELIPARSRPDLTIPRDPLYGRYLLDQVLSTLSGSEGDAERWHACWCSPCLLELIDHLRNRDLKSTQPVMWEAYSAILRGLAGKNWDRPEWLWSDSGVARIIALQNWRSHLQDAVAGKHVIGAVATGPLAGLLGVDGQSLASTEIGKACPGLKYIVVEGEEEGVLSRGAARCAVQMACGETAYYDTLPRISTLVRRRGEPIWGDLLESEDRYVAGGKLWRERRDFGFAIPADGGSAASTPPVSGGKGNPFEKRLSIAVAHEESATVRELKVEHLPRTRRQQKVLLDVSLEPAQGNARIELCPIDAQYLRRRRVIFDWRDAVDTHKTPEEHLREMPRYFPPTGVRMASRLKWAASLSCVEEVLAKPYLNKQGMHQLHQLMMAKDTTRPKEDVTAVASDGSVTHKEQILEALIERLSLHLLKPRISTELRLEIIRVLAYCSADHPEFDRFIANKLQDMSVADTSDDGVAIMIAAGQCFREASTAAIALRKCVGQWVRMKKIHIEWLKASARLMGYREHATAELDTDDAYLLLDGAASIFQSELRARNAMHLFIASAKVIVFLLRRRAYDESFLDPDDDRAVRIKDAFRKAIDDLKSGRLETFRGGSVDLPSLLQQMIDYIDKRGGGTILVEV